DRLGELLGDVDGVLAGHGVDDEQHVVGAGDLADPHELVHEGLVHVQAAARVDDEDVLAVLLGLLARPGGDVHRVGVRAALVNRRTTLKCTSASSSARRISRMAALTSSSLRVPRERTSLRVPWSLSASESNTSIQSATTAAPVRGARAEPAARAARGARP